ncbi:MAG: nucleotidyltransferase domain-containing protein [Bacteroidetes bacterium]|nr:nucleotidyltransferase domain-containing protein [Bacteroidota bacterium]
MKLRIKSEHIEAIKKIIKDSFGKDAKVYLFGSRTDDNKKGGDIDLYIETDVKENIFEKKIKIMGALHKVLGEQKIDIVINNFSSDKYIYTVAKIEGLLL